MVLPVTKMARKHVNRVRSSAPSPGGRNLTASDDRRMLLLLLPGETTRAPSCLVREEVEAAKGLEVLQERWRQPYSGITVSKWWKTITHGDLPGRYKRLGFCGEGSIT